MNNADLFAYLATFVSIILAVALTDMIQSTHRLLRARDKVKWDPLTPLFALYMLLGLLSTFFSLWGDAKFDRLTYYGLVAFMMSPTLAALAAFAVLPDDVPEGGLDLREFYFDNRRYLVLLLVLDQVISMIWTLRWATIHNALASPDFWWLFGPVVGSSLAVLAIIYFARNWWIQLGALLAKLVLVHFSAGGWYIDPVATGG